ncbi:hypothetical protein [Leifsonia sp. Leaf264]|uniref:hypothetical protein n=1 Tax=Leifsonia sp. Leaf264 TaxID=1736314 RepID=UPI000700C987|nr:hypothetical protein [Leifsonia sp. Leaf264]KQP01863.1 hypothetical protein ASF30_04700 [Leifsonia sp. Leaf264]
MIGGAALFRSRPGTRGWAWFAAVFGLAAAALLLNPVTFNAYLPTTDPELADGRGLDLRGLGFLIGGGPPGVLTTIIVIVALMIRTAQGFDRSHDGRPDEQKGNE